MLVSKGFGSAAAAEAEESHGGSWVLRALEGFEGSLWGWVKGRRWRLERFSVSVSVEDGDNGLRVSPRPTALVRGGRTSCSWASDLGQPSM